MLTKTLLDVIGVTLFQQALFFANLRFVVGEYHLYCYQTYIYHLRCGPFQPPSVSRSRLPGETL